MKSFCYCFRCGCRHRGLFCSIPKHGRRSDERLRRWSDSFRRAYPRLLSPNELLPPSARICRISLLPHHSNRKPQFDSAAPEIHPNPDCDRAKHHDTISAKRETTKATAVQEDIDHIHRLEQARESGVRIFFEKLDEQDVEIETFVDGFVKKNGYDPRVLPHIVVSKNKNSQSGNSATDDVHAPRVGYFDLSSLLNSTCSHKSQILSRLTGFSNSDDFSQFVREVCMDYAVKAGKWKHRMSQQSAIELALMRVRTARTFLDLSLFTPFSVDTVRRCVHDVLPAMSIVCERYLYLPSREVLQSPTGHRELIPGAVLAIDSTYLYTKKPRSYHLQEAFWLEHKGRDGAKVMIAVLLNGHICGFSGPNGSESEDLQWESLVEHLGLPNWLREGDVVLRDRGYDRTVRARDFNAKHNIEVLQPHNQGSTGFTSQQAYENRAIASARAVVEQVNARLKSFRLLSHLSLNEVVHWRCYINIAAGLSNHCFKPFYSDTPQALDISLSGDSLSFPETLPPDGRTTDSSLFSARYLKSFSDPDGLPLVDSKATQKDKSTPTSESSCPTTPVGIQNVQPTGTECIVQLGKNSPSADVLAHISQFVTEATNSALPDARLSEEVLLGLTRTKLQQLATDLTEASSGNKPIIASRILTRWKKASQLRESASSLASLACQWPPGWIASAVSIARLQPTFPTNSDWRRAVQESFNKELPWNALESASASCFPKITETSIKNYLRTPTVSNSSNHSATFNRSTSFLKGNCGFVHDRIEYLVHEASHKILIHGTVRPSMSKSQRNHEVYILVCFPDQQQNHTQPESSSQQDLPPQQPQTLQPLASIERLYKHCTCKNGTSGNCSHIAAILSRVGMLQGNISPKNSLFDDLICDSVDDSRLKKAHVIKIQRSVTNSSNIRMEIQ